MKSHTEIAAGPPQGDRPLGGRRRAATRRGDLTYPLTIYYDASCGLCRSEMEALKARDAGDVLRLVDCSKPALDLASEAAEGISRDMMMSRIHARDARGQWFRGLDVFAAAYRAAGLRTVARIYDSALLRPLFDRLYPWIADNRNRLSRFGLPKLFRLLGPSAASSASHCDACAQVPDRRPRV